MGHYQDIIDREDELREQAYRERYQQALNDFITTKSPEDIKSIVERIASLRFECNSGSEMVATRKQFAALDNLFETISGWTPPRRF